MPPQISWASVGDHHKLKLERTTADEGHPTKSVGFAAVQQRQDLANKLSLFSVLAA